MEIGNIKRNLKSCGTSVEIGVCSDITASNVSIGDYTSLEKTQEF